MTIRISILHGSDGKYHLYDETKKQAMDWPPCDTKAQAEEERADFYRQLRQLASDEASERINTNRE